MPQVLPITAQKALTTEPIDQNLFSHKWGKLVCEQHELFMKPRLKHMGLICHSVLAILQTAILCMFYEFFTKMIEQKQPRISHNLEQF